jgi:RNA polymerase sigma-70 factor (ECF subfamily)
MNRRPKDLSDTEIAGLAAAASGGDSTAFGALVRATQSYAYALAFRFLCSEQDARDVVQEAFVKVWEHLGDYDRSKKFTTWLYAIVSNISLDHLRSRKRRLNLFASGSDTDPIDPRELESVHSNAELAAIVQKLAGDLPRVQRLVFTLRDLQDLSVGEAVEASGLSEASVKTNLHLARKRIRELLVRNDYVKGEP